MPRLNAYASLLSVAVMTAAVVVWSTRRRPEVRASVAFVSRPLAFEPNVGQWNEEVSFAARGRGGAVLMLRSGWAFGRGGAWVRARLLGSHSRRAPEGVSALAARANFFLGDDPSAWQTNVPLYSEVRYPSVYPSIDLRFHANDRHVELDFVVKPGGRPEQIRISFEGADALELTPTGDLHVRIRDSDMVWTLPFVYQERAGAREPLPGSFEIEGTMVGFRVGTYDVSRTLVIDPTLLYASHLGGTSAEDAPTVAVDSAGYAYIAGRTDSTDFPALSAFQGAKATSTDAFVSKLDPTGSSLVYSTFLGGGGSEEVFAIKVDPGGNAYVAGETTSTNFPTQSPFQATNAGATDAFVAKIGPTGSTLVYSTYLGGGANDHGYGIAVGDGGEAYVAGQTFSTNFPTQGPIQPTNGGGFDGFIAKLTAAGTTLAYSTYLGGSGTEGATVAVDDNGQAFVTGRTSSTNFPTQSAFQAINDGGLDAYVAKLHANGGSLLYATYLGGSGDDVSHGIAVDPSGNAYVTGSTASTNFPIRSAFQSAIDGGTDAYVAKLGPTGATLIYATFLGGRGYEEADCIAVDSAGSAIVGGYTNSTNFPLVDAHQLTVDGGFDAFVTKLDPSGLSITYSTYLGGNSVDVVEGIAVSADGTAYVAGGTGSTNFPTTPGAYQLTNAGSTENFLAAIALPAQDAGAPDAGFSTDGGTAALVYSVGCDCSATGGGDALGWLALAALIQRRTRRKTR